jgi:acetyltransferase-like isoleucine patch superfamily enzyme
MHKIIHMLLSMPGLALFHAVRMKRRALMAAYSPLFGSHGRNFWFDPDGQFSYQNIHVGDNVSLGVRAALMATRSKIVVGSNVMFGPEVAILGGNHRTDGR